MANLLQPTIQNIGDDSTFEIKKIMGVQKHLNLIFQYRDQPQTPRVDLTGYTISAVIEEIDSLNSETQLSAGFTVVTGGETWLLTESNGYTNNIDPTRGTVRIILPDSIGINSRNNAAKTNTSRDVPAPAQPKKYLLGIFAEKGSGTDKVSFEIRGILSLEYSIVNG